LPAGRGGRDLPAREAKSVAVAAAVNLNDHVVRVDVGVVGDGDGDDLSPAPGRFA
jgi:hypothetical protein